MTGRSRRTDASGSAVVVEHEGMPEGYVPPSTSVQPAAEVASPAEDEPTDAVAAEVRSSIEHTDRPVFGRALPPIDDSAYPQGSTPLDDLVDDHPLSAAEALVEVFRRVEPITKGRKADPSVGGYSFRGIDDVYAALHDLFGEVGLVVLPSVIERLTEQRPRANGSGANYITHLHVRLRFLAADGSVEECDAWGEGGDTGDKGTGKATSQAMKSALLAAFLIPTEASSDDDPDQTNTPPSRAWTPEEQARARTALDAAREQTTLDALVATGRRAARGELLDVPIVDADGSIAPLRLHLDRLRLALESRVPEQQGQQS